MIRLYLPVLRRRVVEAVDDSATSSAASEHLSVSVATAVLWRQTGTFAVKPNGGICQPLDDHVDEIITPVEDEYDRTL